jgi:hypothetical protein
MPCLGLTGGGSLVEPIPGLLSLGIVDLVISNQ